MWESFCDFGVGYRLIHNRNFTVTVIISKAGMFMVVVMIMIC